MTSTALFGAAGAAAHSPTRSQSLQIYAAEIAGPWDFCPHGSWKFKTQPSRSAENGVLAAIRRGSILLRL
jgi:hypothetical protein